MTDRELLEKAAKAAGIAGHYKEAEGVFAGGIFYNDELDCLRCWNPLEDDGDALRLAAGLRIDVTYWAFGKDAVMASDSVDRFDGWFEEPYGDDRAAATRLAIVRAAAEIADAPGAA